VALTPDQVQARAQELLKIRGREKERLDKIRMYVRGEPELTWLPPDAPLELKALANIAKVNILRLVPESETQSLYVDGYRRENTGHAKAVWDIWQRNQFDSRQLGITRAASTYGAAYGITLPGEPVPVLRGASPRQLTAAYGDDDVWPEFALEKRHHGQWRLYDNQDVHTLYLGQGGFDHRDTESHDQGVCPIVRYLPTVDLDDPVVGTIEPLMDLQDQINITTFLLLVAQHYGAHGQRYIIGWLAKGADRVKAAAANLLTIPKKPGEVALGQFDPVPLDPYIDSREATLRHLAVISQTPANELLGQIVQISAEALDAVNAATDRKLIERETALGEGHEQLLGRAGEMAGIPDDPLAEVMWKDTAARRLGLVVSALEILGEKLDVPVQELYEMVPGVSQSTVDRWIEARAERDRQAARDGTADGDHDLDNTDADPAAQPVARAAELTAV